MALNTIANEQAKADGKTMEWIKTWIDYLATHPDATLWYRALDMALNIHYDVSYLSETQGCSRAAGYFFLWWTLKDNKLIKVNGAIHTLRSFQKIVASSAAKSEIGAIIIITKEENILRPTLEEIRHKQQPGVIHCEN